ENLLRVPNAYGACPSRASSSEKVQRVALGTSVNAAESSRVADHVTTTSAAAHAVITRRVGSPAAPAHLRDGKKCAPVLQPQRPRSPAKQDVVEPLVRQRLFDWQKYHGVRSGSPLFPTSPTSTYSSAAAAAFGTTVQRGSKRYIIPHAARGKQ
ncbi:unnamed protein product, partial [Amoebophrya sp. A25]